MSDNQLLVTVTVSLGEEGPQFSYEPAGPVYVTQKRSQITYKLIDNSGKGLSLAGAGFNNPFNGVIDAVEIGSDGSLNLYDTDKIVGEAHFHLIFNVAGNTLQLCSPDPQVINKGSN